MSKTEKKFYPKFKGKVSGGVVIYEDQSSYEMYLSTMDGQEVETVTKPPSKERSRHEEKFYYGVVVKMVSEEMCVPPQEAHTLMAKMFLTIEDQSPVGYRYERVQSTTELSDKAYRAYWNQCIAWAALPATGEGLTVNSGLSLYIPMPNEVDYSQT